MSLLRVEGLSKAYGGLQAVESVSFEVGSGEIYALLGPNGAGKTTTIAMIAGLLQADQGRVLINGADFASNPAQAKSFMGVVPQEIALYEELSGRENLEFWGRIAGLSGVEARQRTTELLEALSLTDRRRLLAARSPIGGMQRRINIAAALLHRPKLLLLDEPTVGIDPQARMKILQFIQGALKAPGILYTTHYLEEAESLCRRIGIIDHGKLLAEGTLHELQERLAGDKVFVLEGDLSGATPESWPGFLQHFHLLQRSAGQWLVAAIGTRDPGDCLRELLNLPVRIENVTIKRPNLQPRLPPAYRLPIARMRTLRVLLSKDLLRAIRNPAAWIVFLTIPLLITGLLGLVFGPKPGSSGLGRIRFALVDEDDSMLTKYLAVH